MIKKYLYTKFPKFYGQFIYSKNKYLLFLKIIKLKLGLEVYFGGKSQDQWVLKEIFNFRKKGYFVDLASTDGILENNTYLLEKKYLWQGIAIEPNVNFFEKLKKNRSCICLNKVISDKDSCVDFIYNGGIGGIVGEEFDNKISKRKKIIEKAQKLQKIKKVSTTTLEKILRENDAPKVIDYLSLDVEGAETAVLKNFPFYKYIFLSMTVERPTKELNKILFENNYIFAKNYKVDSFYIHETMLKNLSINLENFSQVPPKKW